MVSSGSGMVRLIQIRLLHYVPSWEVEMIHSFVVNRSILVRR